MRYTPWRFPEWENIGRVHEWRRYISDEVRTMWPTFTDAQQAALYRQANEIASLEEWP
jgi:hypothetical protein